MSRITSGSQNEAASSLSLILLSVFCLGAAGQSPVTEDPSTDVREYCEWETFNATCRQDEVILIQGARYGRMALGRCVTQNYGHIGCGTDVTSDFDLECSGKRTCTISVISLHDKRSCPKDFKSYLEAGYTCLKVFHPNTSKCPTDGVVKLTEPSGYISSLVTVETGLGLGSCPFRIQVYPYQRINLTLIDLTMSAGSNHWYYGGQQHQGNCLIYGTISEPSGAINRTICGGRIRESVIQTSRKNVLEIRLSETATRKQRFLLKYDAFGCPPLSVSPEAWSQSYGDHVVVHCNQTDEAWYLTCKGTQWVGHVGNCTPSTILDGGKNWGLTNVFGGVGEFPLGILIVVTLGVAIGVAIGVMMLVAVLAYMKRRRRRKIRSRSNYVLKHVGESDPSTLTSLTSKTDVDSTPMIRRERVQPSSGQCTPGTISRQYLDSWQRTRPLPVPRSTAESMDQEGDVAAVTPESTSPGIFMTFRPDFDRTVLSGHQVACTYPQDGRDRLTPYYFKVDPTAAVAHEYSTGRPDVLSTCNLCRNSTSHNTVTNL